MTSRYWWLPPMAFLQAADILLTQRAGLAYEINPLVLRLWEGTGVWLVALAKAAIVVSACLAARLARDDSERLTLDAVMLLGVVYMTGVCILNVRVLILVS